MSVSWLVPAAWLGLAFVAIPIVIHLLARQRSPRLPFPSLRFVPASQFAAFRRRLITSWPLLTVRILIVLAAVAAAAGPIFISAGRRDAWDARTVRAIVVTGASEPLAPVLADAEADGYRVERFSMGHLPDGVRAAADWLAAQPPAGREVVIVGDVQEGRLQRRDFGVLPPQVGIRFLPVVLEPRDTRIELQGVGEFPNGTVTRFRLTVIPEIGETRARYERDDDVELPPLRIAAAPADQPFADALLRAVWREGVVAGAAAQPRPGKAFSGNPGIVILFEGGTVPPPATVEPSEPSPELASHLAGELAADVPSARSEIKSGQLVIGVPMSIRDERATGIVARVVRIAYRERLDYLEPRRLSSATLASWSRPSSGSPTDILPGDEGDRRWFWGAALILLGVEQVIRRKRRHA